MKVGFTFPYQMSKSSAAAALRAGEAAGLSSVWLYENLYGPGVFACAGFAAAVVDRAAIAVGTTSPFARTPGALAMEACKLHDLTGGRFTLGLAAANPELIAGMGGTAGNPLAAIEDTLRIVRAAATNGIDRYDGERFQVNGLRLMWDPDFGPPSLVVGTFRPKMMQIASAHADGLLISSHTPLRLVANTVTSFRSAWAAAGRQGEPRIVAYVPFSFSADESEAVDQLRPRLAAAIARLPVDPTIGELVEAGGAIAADELADLARRLLAEPGRADLVPSSVVRAHAIVATKFSCAERFQEYENAGVTELVLFELASLPSLRAAFEHLSTLQLDDDA